MMLHMLVHFSGRLSSKGLEMVSVKVERSEIFHSTEVLRVKHCVIAASLGMDNERLPRGISVTTLNIMRTGSSAPATARSKSCKRHYDVDGCITIRAESCRDRGRAARTTNRFRAASPLPRFRESTTHQRQRGFASNALLPK